MKVRVSTASAVAGGLVMLMVGLSASGLRAAKGPMDDLAGRWAGAGTVQWKNGRQEPYKCVVTYFLGDGGASVKQNLRCSSTAENKLDIATVMRISGETITGTWEERQTSMTGNVKGKVTPTGYHALAHNQFFNAVFEIAMAGACDQSVTIRPSRDIQLITANLKKC